MDFDRIFVRTVVICLPLCLVIGSCKKRKEFKEENGQSAEDVRTFQAQNDEVTGDVNVVLMEQSLLRGRSASDPGGNPARTELCGVDVDTSDIFSGIIRLHYNGKSCQGIKKTGSIIITVQNYPLRKWKNKDCKLKLDFTAYKVTRADGKSIQIDGTEYMTNVSGNTWYDLRYLNAGSLVQTHTAENLKISFDNSNTAIFSIDRKLTFSYSNSSKITSCKVEGLGSANGNDNLDNWGQNRNGVNFTTEISTPLVWKSSCGGAAPVEGATVVRLEGKSYSMSCVFGVDSEGNDASGSSSCPYGWKASWSYKKKTSTSTFSYN